MGCTSSKQARIDRRRSPSPLFRCRSLPVHHPARHKGDSYHVVALTSSTLGSLRLDNAAGAGEEMMKSTNDKDFGGEVDGAKAWSEMIERRIPKTPTKTPPNEPEMIDARELMDGLEDGSPIRELPAAFDRSFTFHTVREADPSPEMMPISKFTNGSPSPKPMWMMEAGLEDSIVADFDPDMISTFRKALEELSPQHPVLCCSLETEKFAGNGREVPNFTGIVKARITAFQEKIDAKKNNGNGNANADDPVTDLTYNCPPGGEGKVVLYFTSLRGVRKTYEDCWSASVILKGYSVRVDERDVSMHGGFKDELNEILGAGYGGSQLPRVFANGRYLGGAEEVRQMHEAGELATALEGCEMASTGKGGGLAPCEGCGDLRFVPCETCSGSCKVYVEEEDEEGDDELGAFRRCSDCNENGLVRCSLCC